MKILFFLIIIIILVTFYHFKQIEQFTLENLKIDSLHIQNIVPLVEPKENGFIITAVDPNNFNPNQLYKIYSLKNINDENNNYKPLLNSKIDDISVIVDLCWFHDDITSSYLSTGKKLSTSFASKGLIFLLFKKRI